MANYNYFEQAKKPEDNKQVHPVWRGIGCLIIILTPIVSWAASMVLLEFGKKAKWPILNELSGNISFPYFIYQVPTIGQAASYFSSIPYLPALLLFFVLFVVMFSSVFSIINAILYRMFGPPRYSSKDAPATRKKPKRYSR